MSLEKIRHCHKIQFHLSLTSNFENLPLDIFNHYFEVDNSVYIQFVGLIPAQHGLTDGLRLCACEYEPPSKRRCKMTVGLIFPASGTNSP